MAPPTKTNPGLRNEPPGDIRDAMDIAAGLCAARGTRLTPLRRRVLEILWQGNRPMGAYEILDLLRADQPGAAPPTVYRALEFLLDNRLIHRIEGLNAFIRCASPGADHAPHILVCRSCKRATEVDYELIGSAVARLGSDLGFKVEKAVIELTGLCADCADA